MKEIVNQWCAEIYTDIDSILTKYTNKQVKDLKEALPVVQGEIESYLQEKFYSHVINDLPEVRIVFDNGNMILSLHDKSTGEKIESIENLVKLKANWNIGDKVN